jgi:hypothetical protein
MTKSERRNPEHPNLYGLHQAKGIQPLCHSCCPLDESKSLRCLNRKTIFGLIADHVFFHRTIHDTNFKAASRARYLAPTALGLW